MHWKTRRKILTATKIYLTDDLHQPDCCTEIRIQLPTKEFVLIDLQYPLPKKIEYISLFPSGFNYNPDTATKKIIIYGKSKSLEILRNSVNICNVKTITEVIKLVEDMENLEFYI